jgi:hypothetical protein
VPYLPGHLLHTALNTHYTTEQRFSMYNNWDHQNWVQSEQLFVNYHYPPGNTAEYQRTHLKLISTFHPKQFEDGEFYGTWGKNPYWQNILFVNYAAENITEITNLAQRKRTDMPGHAQQVYNVELDCFQQLKKNKADALLIHWNQLKTKEQFCESIANIAQTIRIKFYEKYVLELWLKWNIENKKLFNLDKKN